MYQQLAEQICSALKLPNDHPIVPTWGQLPSIDLVVMIESILRTGDTKTAAKDLAVSYKRIFTATRKLKFPRLNGGNETYRYKFLQLIKFKECNHCKSILPYSEFYIDRTTSDKRACRCKQCASIWFKQYYENNKNYHNSYCAKRKRNLDRFLSDEEINEVFVNGNWSCACCGITNTDHIENYGQRLHIDHIVPVSRGGTTTVENSQLLCRSCNSSKGSK